MFVSTTRRRPSVHELSPTFLLAPSISSSAQAIHSPGQASTSSRRAAKPRGFKAHNRPVLSDCPSPPKTSFSSPSLSRSFSSPSMSLSLSVSPFIPFIPARLTLSGTPRHTSSTTNTSNLSSALIPDAAQWSVVSGDSVRKDSLGKGRDSTSELDYVHVIKSESRVQSRPA